MNYKSIQDSLNNEFNEIDRKIIFWYDDNAEYEEEIDSIQLENAKLLKLTGDNYLYTKYLLEEINPKTNYLVYAPFSKPSDMDNHLSDTIYYSKLFYTDKVYNLCDELNIPDRFRDHMKLYHKFWKSNERIEKFKNLNIEKYDNETIDIGILSVLAGVKIPNFDEILKIIISMDFPENKFLSEYEKFDVIGAFWELCNTYYGYNEENPSLERLIITLLITYTAKKIKGDLPKSWQNFVSIKGNDTEVFISNFMNNIKYKEKYNNISDAVAQKIRAEELLKNINVEQYMHCDTFKNFDKNIIEHYADLLTSNKETAENLFSSIEIRMKSHFIDMYKNYYSVLKNANNILKYTKTFCNNVQVKGVDDVVDCYVNEWSEIDKYYRLFYSAYDEIEPTEKIELLRDLVENIYTNDFLTKVNILWANKLENIKSYSEIRGFKQFDFYKNEVLPAEEKQITAVIISDAFRYECGKELQDKLMSLPNFSADLSFMISSIPSYTKLGMASLLPHKEIKIDAKYDVSVDGIMCSSTENRQKILEKYNSQSIAITYDNLMSYTKREDIRKLLDGKRIIYVYHNHIDARGDNSASENEVLFACEEAMNEITKLIKKLTSEKSITNFIVTSDHGFIYKRGKLDESDKISNISSKNIFLNKRFILSNNKYDMDGTLNYSMDYLGDENSELFVTVPRGVDIFKIPGGGQNYVHGGISLQEIIIPLLKIKTERYKVETKNVEVILSSVSRKITNLITNIDFMQKENVTDTVLPIKLRVFFISEFGEVISNENTIIANKKNESPENRLFKLSFSLKNKKYSRSDKYCLVLIDEKTGLEAARHEYIIDIAFANDFDFGF